MPYRSFLCWALLIGEMAIGVNRKSELGLIPKLRSTDSSINTDCLFADSESFIGHTGMALLVSE